MDNNFKNLVFEGGGVKGIAYGGALAVMDSMGILNRIERVAGTSAGAINATLLAVGYTYEEVSTIISKTNFKDFEDSGAFLIGDIANFVKHYGWYKGEAFKEWLGDLIKEKTGKADITFAELKEGEGAFKQLYIICSNLSMQRAEVLSHEAFHAPNTPIRDAVRMSMSIPLYFRSVKQGANIYVDGGVTWNYPINLFDYKKYLSNDKNATAVKYSTNPDYVFNYETLGFRLDSKSVIEYAKHNWASEPIEIKNIKDYISGLINFMMEAANKSHLKSNDWNRTIFIDTLDVKTTEFNLPEQKIQALIESGKICTQNYFNWRKTDAEFGALPV
jgi:NTE family protein